MQRMLARTMLHGVALMSSALAQTEPIGPPPATPNPGWNLHRPAAILALGLAAASLSWDEAEPVAMTQGIENSGLDALGDVGNAYGGGWVIGGGSAALLTAGVASGHEKTRALGADLCLSFASAALVAGVIKHSVARRRPSGGSLSFPSGHTTAAFSTVPVIGHHLGWQFGLLTAVVATGTGLGRMEEGKHFLSDVFFGAAIGLAMGDLVVQRRARQGILQGLAVSPGGVSYTMRF